ncbi:MAG: hypothetical protein M1818_000771 [Claussenomyces sp. TS43310]|nr:MAG: hypothetical protein M1818_000771 [Claussenomyces sp. TS43310]
MSMSSSFTGAFTGVRLAGKPKDKLYDLEYKCFLLSHPKYADLEIEKGDFAEALELTGKAKARFESDDLVERGRALVQESIAFGVTHMRAFVEVDPEVALKCLEAGLLLKQEFRDRCYIQICAFAQDPVFSQDDGGHCMRQLLATAAGKDGVDVIGSTPYVETSPESEKANVEWMIGLARKLYLHLDFHLDYNLRPDAEPVVHHVIRQLKAMRWPVFRAVTLGHCTRLTLFTTSQWQQLRDSIGDLPVSFVGLPTSDMFMMGRPTSGSIGGGERVRGTLQILQMITEYGLQGAIGVNNVGNAFTPQGTCDPLSVATLGVGVYQAGTKAHAEILLVGEESCAATSPLKSIGIPQLTRGDDLLQMFNK